MILFAVFSRAWRFQSSLDDFFDMSSVVDVNGFINGSDFLCVDSEKIKIHDAQFTSFSDRCVCISPVEVLNSTLSLICQDTIFSHFNVKKTGGAIYVRSKGDVAMSKICTCSCNIVNESLYGSFIFASYLTSYSSNLMSIVGSPDANSTASSTTYLNFDKGNIKNVNASASISNTFACLPNVHCTYSFITELSNSIIKNINVATLISRRSFLEYSNFINNTIQSTVYVTGVVRMQNDVDLTLNLVSNCAFLDNTASYIITTTSNASVLVSDTFIDSGKLKLDVDYTNAAMSPQTIRINHFATKEYCLTEEFNNVVTFNDMMSLETKIPQKDNDNTNSKNDTLIIVLVSISACLVITLIVVIIWAARTIHETTKVSAKIENVDDLNERKYEYEYEEETDVCHQNQNDHISHAANKNQSSQEYQNDYNDQSNDTMTSISISDDTTTNN